MFDINGGEFLILLVVAVLVIGPQRLPQYAEQLGRWTRSARVMLREAGSRVRAELGDDAPDVDWEHLDPRRYDPRRIVREALLDDPAEPPPASAPGPPGPTPRGARPERNAAPVPPPYDDEAT